MRTARRSWLAALLLGCCVLASPPGQAQNYSDIWNNPSEPGWGLTIADHETQLFAVWYTYRADGSPTWFTIPGGTFSQNRRIFSGDVYQTTGPAYNAAVFNPNAVTATRVGTATIDFAPGLGSGVALYTFNIGSVSRSSRIQRQSFGNAAPDWGNDLTDIWYNPNESGWGMTLAQHGNNVFGVWFTYDTDGRPLFVVMPGVNFTGAMSFTGSLYTTRGPYYGNATFDPAQVQVTAAGSMTFSFQALPALKAFPKRGDMNGVFRNSQTFRTIFAQPFGNVSPGAQPLALTILPLEPARAGAPYLQPAATALGGSPPYTFYADTFANGAPPLGLGIEVNGWLSGTTSASYTSDRPFDFGICVRDVGGNSLCRGTTITVLRAEPEQSGLISWRVGNQCNNGQGIRYKFFDRAAGLVFPGPTSYFGIDFGETFTDSFNCIPGNQICLGARTDSGDLTWGVGYTGSGGCTNCCGTCGNAGTYGYTFGCSSQGGTSYYANWSCGGSGQCATIMGGSAGSKGPFCSAASCNNWGRTYIPAGYSCSTTATYSPHPGGSQCSNFP